MSDLPPAKGKRPSFLSESANDELLGMVMALAQEVAVLRERCDTTERLLTANGTLAPNAIEAYRPDAEVDAAREQWRRDYLDRILYVVRARAAEPNRA